MVLIDSNDIRTGCHSDYTKPPETDLNLTAAAADGPTRDLRLMIAMRICSFLHILDFESNSDRKPSSTSPSLSAVSSGPNSSRLNGV
jgi:hypothetical protein